jgi:3-dehydroquinate synthase
MSTVHDSEVLVQRFSVPFEYPVHFTRGVFNPDNPALRDALCYREPARRQRCLCVVEQRVAALHPSLLDNIRRYARTHALSMNLVRPVTVIAGAEACKNEPGALSTLHAIFHEAHLDRQATVICVGGGALQDLVGYAAATAHRGVRVLRVPTTVLSQADSGVGVKNGINAFGKKNFLGSFAPPHAVVIDPLWLRSLPLRDAVAGMAEAVKVALIKDAEFFAWQRAHVAALASCEQAAVEVLVKRCATLHLQHIAGNGDPFERGSARPLDFGHWAAHKLESMTDYRLSHGEAVAIGIALDVHYCAATGLLSQSDAAEIIDFMQRLGLPLWDEALARSHESGLEILRGIEEFREHLGGELTVTLLDGIGHSHEVHALDLEQIQRSVAWLRARARMNPTPPRASVRTAS